MAQSFQFPLKLVRHRAAAGRSISAPAGTWDAAPGQPWVRAADGAPRTLEDTAVVITETNVAERFRGSYSFAELVSFLDAAGFRLFDFLDVRTLGRDGPLNYVDAVFVRS